MAEDRLLVRVQPLKGTEESFFKEQDQKIIMELREKAAEDANNRYCEEHKSHCFRCGTKSLVEVGHGDTKIDICVNHNCGAVHLDPGELEEILKDKKIIISLRKSVLAVFK